MLGDQADGPVGVGRREVDQRRFGDEEERPGKLSGGLHPPSSTTEAAIILRRAVLVKNRRRRSAIASGSSRSSQELAEPGGWPSTRIERLRDVEWAMTRGLPLPDRLLGATALRCR